MNHPEPTGARKAAQRGRLGAGLIAVVLAVASACDTNKLVDLQNPDLITSAVAGDTANITQLRNGVIFEFGRAMTGPAATNGSPGIIGLSGVLSDEMWYASTFPTMLEIDARNTDVTNADLLTVYQYMHRARNLAEQVAQLYTQTTHNNSTDHALVTSLAGITDLWFAENFCSGVPFSQTDLTGQVTFGAGLTTAQMLDSAIARFDQAITRATAASSSDQLNLARVEKGRALLDKDDPAGAATAVAAVPTGFSYDFQYSDNASGQNNGTFQNINTEKRTSVASGEGGNGVVFFRRGSNPPANTIDPRAPVDSSGITSTLVPLYLQQKYPTRGSPITLANGIEARLIEAEAALNKGQSNAYLATLNSLRTTYSVPGVLVDPVTPAARVRQLMTERAFWLWLTAHRVGDLRRMVRYYGFAANTVFPTGQTINGQSYGNDVNLPIPFEEQNNPSFASAACIDRNP